jgi:hypothetical protein
MGRGSAARLKICSLASLQPPADAGAGGLNRGTWPAELAPGARADMHVPVGSNPTVHAPSSLPTRPGGRRARPSYCGASRAHLRAQKTARAGALDAEGGPLPNGGRGGGDSSGRRRSTATGDSPWLGDDAKTDQGCSWVTRRSRRVGAVQSST